MNPQNQISNSENFPPSFITNYEGSQGLTAPLQTPDATPPLPGASSDPIAFSSLLPPGPPGPPGAPAANAFPPLSSGSGAFLPSPTELYSQHRHNNLNYDPITSTPATQIQLVHPTDFFYRPPNDVCHYHICCKEISYETIECLLNNLLNGFNIQFNENQYIFFYRQQQNNRFYQVSCEIASPSFINNYLNKNIYGFETAKNMEQDQLVFTFDQKLYLECHLKQYLRQYLLS